MSNQHTRKRTPSTTTYPPASADYLAAIPRLHDLGLALFPICLGEKRPAWRGCLKHRHTESEYREKLLPHVQAGGLLGFSPGLAGLAILDVDEGDPDELAELLPPLETLPSCRPGRGHLLYPDIDGAAVAHSGRQWEYRSASTRWAGEIISSRHYVVIYDALALANAIMYPDEQVSQVPIERLVIGYHRREDQDQYRRPGAPAGMEPGNRNLGLFDELRAWAYRQPKAGAYPQWLRRCVDRALAIRRTMPDLQGFPEREAIDTAQSVATWTWERPTAGYDPHYSSKQSSRGLQSGIKRRQAIQHRDGLIAALHEDRWSQRKIAQHLGIGQASVGRSLARAKPSLK